VSPNSNSKTKNSTNGLKIDLVKTGVKTEIKTGNSDDESPFVAYRKEEQKIAQEKGMVTPRKKPPKMLFPPAHTPLVQHTDSFDEETGRRVLVNKKTGKKLACFEDDFIVGE